MTFQAPCLMQCRPTENPVLPHGAYYATGLRVSVAQSCPTLCDPMEPARLHCPRNSPGKNTGVGSHTLPQGIFLTQGVNPGSCTAGRSFTISATREACNQYSRTNTTLGLPRGPVAETPSSQSKEPGFDPWVGNKDPTGCN